MGIEDKISGRIKQAAGDLLGHEGLKRQGREEERKAEAEAEAREAQARADAEAQRAEAKREDAEQRAAAAARREFAKADAEIQRDQARVEAADAVADAKAAEARDLELRTDPVELSESSTREELYEEARRLGIEGRSEMTKDELAAEITART
jgi:colicin import membrane protein